VQLIVSASTGGGYDAYARTIARNMARHIPGTPSIVVKNMQGAGGIVATNYVYNVAPRDGSLFAAVINAVAFQPLLGNKAAKFDAKKFLWLGSANSETGLIFVDHKSKVKTFQDLRSRSISFGAAGAGSSTTLYYRLLNGVLGTKIKIILGYKGSSESFMALERGEIEGYFAFWSSLKTRQAELLKAKKIRNIVQIALEKDRELPDIPLVLDFAKSQSERDAVALAVAPLAIGRPFLAPPEVPADRGRALQTAFLATMKDAGFLAEAKKRRLEVSSHMSGERVIALLNKMYATPKDVVAKVAALSKRKKKKRAK
jgi:tripartite-type tricarboxylate transporter receptor subunit TctC